MKIVLSEIWDYYIEFLDWKTTSLKNLDEPKDDINSYLELSIDHKQALWDTAKSKTLNKQSLPYWDKLEDGILFRGTYHELKA